MQRIGLYGGCFNPVHQGHLAAARGAMRALALDRVVFIPSGVPPLKGADGLAAGAHRIAMLRAALSDEPGMGVSAIEIDREGPSFTVDTVNDLRATFPADAELFFLLGDDCIGRLPHWKEIERLHAMLRFAILPRCGPGVRPEDDRLIWLDLPRVGVSSTQIRAMLARGARPPATLLPTAVLRYAEQQQIYGSVKDPARA
jgi:nicotinate-nucleotide adenylyltransferase